MKRRNDSLTAEDAKDAEKLLASKQFNFRELPDCVRLILPVHYFEQVSLSA